MKTYFTTGGLFAILILFLSFDFGRFENVVTSIEEERQAQARPLAIVRRFRPLVQIRDTGKLTWVEVKVANPLFDKDTLRTERDGYAVLQLIDNSLARVRSNSVLVIRGEPNARNGLNSRIQVESGEVNLRVEGRVSQYEVSTPSAVAAVKGTEFTTRVLEDGSSEFTVISGVVEIRANASGRTQNLTRRRRAVVDPEGNEIITSTMSNQELRRTQSEYTQLDTSTKPKVIRIRFVNASGQVQEIEVHYFEKPPEP
jgi:hypothetical protein